MSGGERWDGGGAMGSLSPFPCHTKGRLHCMAPYISQQELLSNGCKQEGGEEKGHFSSPEIRFNIYLSVEKENLSYVVVSATI